MPPSFGFKGFARRLVKRLLLVFPSGKGFEDNLYEFTKVSLENVKYEDGGGSCMIISGIC
jgi:hypothetical protein